MISSNGVAMHGEAEFDFVFDAQHVPESYKIFVSPPKMVVEPTAEQEVVPIPEELTQASPAHPKETTPAPISPPVQKPTIAPEPEVPARPIPTSSSSVIMSQNRSWIHSRASVATNNNLSTIKDGAGDDEKSDDVLRPLTPPMPRIKRRRLNLRSKKVLRSDSSSLESLSEAQSMATHSAVHGCDEALPLATPFRNNTTPVKNPALFMLSSGKKQLQEGVVMTPKMIVVEEGQELRSGEVDENQGWTASEKPTGLSNNPTMVYAGNKTTSSATTKTSKKASSAPYRFETPTRSGVSSRPTSLRTATTISATTATTNLTTNATTINTINTNTTTTNTRAKRKSTSLEDHDSVMEKVVVISDDGDLAVNVSDAFDYNSDSDGSYRG